MPYIPKRLRERVDEYIGKSLTLESFSNRLAEFVKLDAVVTYVIYKIIVRMYARGGWSHRTKALKVLESARIEFVRNHVIPYEKEKKKQYGDVT